MAMWLAGWLPAQALQFSPIWRCNILQKYFAFFSKKCLQKTAYEKFLVERGIVKSANQRGMLNRDKNHVNMQRLVDIDNLKRKDLNSVRLNQINQHRMIWSLYENGRRKAILLKASLA